MAHLKIIPSCNLILLASLTNDANEPRCIRHSTVWDTAMENLKENRHRRRAMTKSALNNSLIYQLDAQILYFVIHLLHSSTCFEHYYAHPQEVKLY